MKVALPTEVHRQVLELRRSHSLREVAEKTGLPIGTVKTICSRSGVFRDNPAHRTLFTLPPMQQSSTTALAVPSLPIQEAITGDNDLDAVLWLRSVIKTGQAALIEKAMRAAKRIKTPLLELEERYTQHLRVTNPGNPFATFASFDFADLDMLAKRSIKKLALQTEAASRFGDGLFVDTPAEQFCIDALRGLKRSRMLDFDKQEVCLRFEARADLMPNTLTDCLHELAYWSDLYRLRNSTGSCDNAPEAYARESFVFGSLAHIRSRTKEEAVAVFRYLAAEDRMGDTETEAILLNLIRRA